VRADVVRVASTSWTRRSRGVSGPEDQGSDNRAQVVDGEFFALDTALNQFGQEIVAGLPASVGNHEIDVRVHRRGRSRRAGLHAFWSRFSHVGGVAGPTIAS
jgi:hypothetical protein